MIKSPLNYTGGKYKLLPQILPIFPTNIQTFIDLFCGGCNVGLNVDSEKVIFNDSNAIIINMYESFKNTDKVVLFNQIYQTIEKYGLSSVCDRGYDYYNCKSNDGLGEYNKDRFLKLRDDFNSKTLNNEIDINYYIMLYVLIVYSFNNQIRFNRYGMFNLPVGKRDFNCSMKKKLSDFIDAIHAKDYTFTSFDFRDFNIKSLGSNDFIYVDPPYLVTCASYNEQNGWTETDERDLLKFLTKLNRKKIRFALSNVLESRGKTNKILANWIKRNGDKYKVHHLQFDYSNSNYHIKDKDSFCDEVLITNY